MLCADHPYIWCEVLSVGPSMRGGGLVLTLLASVYTSTAREVRGYSILLTLVLSPRYRTAGSDTPTELSATLPIIISLFYLTQYNI
jgi:hypothetical protein